MFKIKRLHPDAIIPTIGTPGSACYDLYALENTVFQGGEIKLVRTGWAIEPPPGFRINLFVRSSTPLKKGFILANSVAVFDEDYRGEAFVQLMNIKMTQYEQNILRVDGSWGGEKKAWDYSQINTISKGDKIAQFEFVPSNPARGFPLEIVEELSETVRGTGGVGSTGN